MFFPFIFLLLPYPTKPAFLLISIILSIGILAANRKLSSI
jgi:hypothetical protein